LIKFKLCLLCLYVRTELYMPSETFIGYNRYLIRREWPTYYAKKFLIIHTSPLTVIKLQ